MVTGSTARSRERFQKDKPVLDGLDRALLAALDDDPRCSTAELAHSRPHHSSPPQITTAAKLASRSHRNAPAGYCLPI